MEAKSYREQTITDGDQWLNPDEIGRLEKAYTAGQQSVLKDQEKVKMEAKEFDNIIHDAWCSLEGENITDEMHNVKKVRDGDRAVFKAGQEEEKAHWVSEIERQVKDAYEGGKQAGRNEAVEGLDIEFILDCLKQSKRFIWKETGRNICGIQIKKLEQLKEWNMKEDK